MSKSADRIPPTGRPVFHSTSGPRPAGSTCKHWRQIGSLQRVSGSAISPGTTDHVGNERTADKCSNREAPLITWWIFKESEIDLVVGVLNEWRANDIQSSLAAAKSWPQILSSQGWESLAPWPRRRNLLVWAESVDVLLNFYHDSCSLSLAVARLAGLVAAWQGGLFICRGRGIIKLQSLHRMIPPRISCAATGEDWRLFSYMEMIPRKSFAVLYIPSLLFVSLHGLLKVLLRQKRAQSFFHSHANSSSLPQSLFRVCLSVNLPTTFRIWCVCGKWIKFSSVPEIAWQIDYS